MEASEKTPSRVVKKYIPFPFEEVFFILPDGFDHIEVLRNKAHPPDPPGQTTGRIVMQWEFIVSNTGEKAHIDDGAFDLWVGYTADDERRAGGVQSMALWIHNGKEWAEIPSKDVEIVSQGPGMGGYGVVRDIEFSRLDPAVGWFP